MTRIILIAMLMIALAAPHTSHALGDSAHEVDIYETISEHSVVVYSKSYCPYCKRAKELFKQLGVHAEVLELDQMDDGRDIQTALKTITNRGTVPQVFIGGKFVGGSDDLMAAHADGRLKELLAVAGIDIPGSGIRPDL